MNDDVEQNYVFVNNPAQLQHLANDLETEKIFAVDLEADSMYHFKEKVCLIQTATQKSSFLVDPLSVNDLTPLKPLFTRKDIKKVFHGADYDVRSLYRDFKIEIENLFDTEIACRFLGMKTTGLEAVLKKKYDLSLNKKYQRKDWSRRPLPAEMLKYAVRDVAYLIPLAIDLEKELKAKGRLLWVREECDNLTKARPALTETGPLFLRFKGAGRLAPRDLAVLEALLQFRKKKAEKKDKPVFKIIGSDSLMKMTRVKPVTFKQLEDLHTLNKKQIDMYGTDLVVKVRNALKVPKNKLPVFPRKKAPAVESQVPKRVKAFKKWRDDKAKKWGLDPTLICSRTLMTAIAVRNPRRIEDLKTVTGIRGWQIKAFGENFVAILKNL